MATKCQADASLSSDASMAALPALMLILSDSSAPACTDRTVTTIEAMQLNDNEPQINGSDTDTHIEFLLNSSQESGEKCTVNPKYSPVNFQKKTQRDFDQELRLHASDEHSLENALRTLVSNMPLDHGDTGGYIDAPSTATLAHVVTEAREDVARVWDDFMTSIEEPNATNCRRGAPDPTDPYRIFRLADFPMPPPRRFYHRVWRSFGRRLFQREHETCITMSVPIEGADAPD
jgi:hypothetical protein